MGHEMIEAQRQLNNVHNIYYDHLFLQSLRDMDLFRKLAWVYRSNWRVLHVDGFEGGRPLPIRMGTPRQFFNYEVTE